LSATALSCRESLHTAEADATQTRQFCRVRRGGVNWLGERRRLWCVCTTEHAGCDTSALFACRLLSDDVTSAASTSPLRTQRQLRVDRLASHTYRLFNSSAPPPYIQFEIALKTVETCDVWEGNRRSGVAPPRGGRLLPPAANSTIVKSTTGNPWLWRRTGHASPQICCGWEGNRGSVSSR